MKFIFTILLITLINFCSNSQNITQSSNFINNIVNYRLESIRNIDTNIQRFDNSISKWNILEKCPGERLDLLRNINLNLITYGMNPKYYEAHILKNFKESQLANVMYEYDTYIIYDNPEFFDLVFNGFLKPSFPYQLKLNNFKKELEFLSIKPNEVYGEMDINSGTNAFIYAMYCESLKINIYLPNDYLVNYAKQKLERNKEKIKKENIEIMKLPNEKNNLESKKVDYLVVRNSFQYCTSQAEQLDYFKSFLKPGGKLIITNHFRTDESYCSASMELKETIENIETNGFNYVSHITVNENTMIKFTLTQD